MEIQLYEFLNSKTEWVWSASRSGRFTGTENAAGTSCIEGLVVPRAVRDVSATRKIFLAFPKIDTLSLNISDVHVQIAFCHITIDINKVTINRVKHNFN